MWFILFFQKDDRATLCELEDPPSWLAKTKSDT
jgi:hypothetical protein